MYRSPLAAGRRLRGRPARAPSTAHSTVDPGPLEPRPTWCPAATRLVRREAPRGARTSAREAVRGAAERHERRSERTGRRPACRGSSTGHLREGRTRLGARIRHGGAARLIVTNHPIGGPVFAGPQIQPWACQDGAQDAQCNQPPTFRFLYLPKGAPTAAAAIPGTSSNATAARSSPTTRRTRRPTTRSRRRRRPRA